MVNDCMEAEIRNAVNLSEEELQLLAIKIPAACFYVQVLNDRAIDVALSGNTGRHGNRTSQNYSRR